jgi:hypothetical protein
VPFPDAVTDRRRETLMPHDFLHQSRIFRLCHSDGAERVPCAIQFQGIRNFELASHTSERVLESAQPDMARTRFLRRKAPTLS